VPAQFGAALLPEEEVLTPTESSLRQVQPDPGIRRWPADCRKSDPGNQSGHPRDCNKKLSRLPLARRPTEGPLPGSGRCALGNLGSRDDRTRRRGCPSRVQALGMPKVRGANLRGVWKSYGPSSRC
jgi:hypothetical protein